LWNAKKGIKRGFRLHLLDIGGHQSLIKAPEDKLLKAVTGMDGWIDY
jgi:hypothetical protein